MLTAVTRRPSLFSTLAILMLVTTSTVSSAQSNRDALDRSTASTLGDLLEQIPGLHLLRQGGAGGVLSLRGLTGHNTVTERDGIPLRSPSAGDALDPVLLTVDPGALSSVKVELGPSSSRWGSGAIGGVLHLESRSPTLFEDGVEGQIVAQGGSSSLDAGGGGRFEWRDGSTSLLGGISARQTGQLNPGDPFADQLDTEVTQLAADLRAGVLSDTGEFAAYYSGVRQSDLSDPIPGSSDLVAARASDFGWIGWHREDRTHWVAETDIKLAVARQAQTRSLAGDESVLHGALAASVTTTHFFDLEVEWVVDLSVDSVSSESTDFDAVDGSEVLTAGTGAGAVLRIDEATDIQAGARIDLSALSVPATQDSEAAELSGLAGAGSLGVGHQLVPELRLHLGLTTGFRHPSLADVSGFGRTATGTVLANPDLREESAGGGQLGLVASTEALTLSLTGHYTFLWDRITEMATGELDPENLDAFGAPLPIIRTINIGEARTFGIDTLSVFQFGDVRSVFSVSWLEGHDLTAIRHLPGIAPISGRFALEVDGGSWGLSPYARFGLPRDNTAPGEIATEGYAVVGLSGHAALGDWGLLAVALDNLADQGYRYHGSRIPEPGFNAMMRIVFRAP
jgi:outer membrane receptor protein involved in Fe transport